ncbi:MAG: PKD domain-containing protein [Phycisphaerae bacterium]
MMIQTQPTPCVGPTFQSVKRQTGKSVPHRFAYALLGTAFLFCIAAPGCSQYIDPNVPEPIRPFIEPELGGDYLLYRPSSYNREQVWPLIVVCHASNRESPNKRIRAWTQLAETHGFLVAAPKLNGTRKRWSVNAAKQITLQRQDENHILTTVRHIRAGHNISDDRIFIHGWSGGAYAALHTGLRHPEIFRAIALSQPRFEEGYLADADDAIDPHQPVFVNYSVVDAITGKHARRCVDWLRIHGTNLTKDSTGSVHPTDSHRPIEFFEEVIRKMPWIRIRGFPTGVDNPLEIQFKLQCSFRPASYLWEFGDGDESAVAQPVHAYAAPGTYHVTVTVDHPNGRQHRRTLKLKVP